MAKVLLIHWNELECLERARTLEAAGHSVSARWNVEDYAQICDPLPGLMVISLDRLPSHGRAVAEWFWEAKYRQKIPMVFAGGKPDKVHSMQQKFPKAIYCATENLAATVASVSGTGPSNS